MKFEGPASYSSLSRYCIEVQAESSLVSSVEHVLSEHVNLSTVVTDRENLGSLWVEALKGEVSSSLVSSVVFNHSFRV